jgi:galactose mutarotase-like enzyme
MSRDPGRTIRLVRDGAEAEIALRGAEPVRWRVGGRDLLWSGDPAHWSYHAPILFPVVGASRDGRIGIGGRSYPMPQHGFARVSDFALVERDEASARLRLLDTDDTRASFPFAFRLDIVATLAADSLALDFEVSNTGADAMPYALGFHPAFPWPLAGPGKAGHRVAFEAAERPTVPEVAPGGLLARTTREVPLQGRILPLDPELFTEALVFLEARSRSFGFEGPDEAAIALRAENFPHLAVWSRPDAPFLSLETWTGHADWEDANGDLAARASMIRLEGGDARRHRVVMAARGPAGVQPAACLDLGP